MSQEITGGCQCGAVRYALSRVPDTEFCHCRMCQRAVGNVFAALSMVAKDELRWTRGEPAFYASSNVAKRGFCRDCGTPLTFAFDDRPRIEVTTGSLDDPEIAPVQEHFGVESRLSWLHVNEDLPQHRTEDSADSPANTPEFVAQQGGV